MKSYQIKFVRIICNIWQFVRIKILVSMPLLVLLLPFFWAFIAVAQDDGSGSGGDGGSGGGDSGSGGGGGDGGGDTPDLPPELMSWGTFYCNIFARLLWVWPSTPDGLRLADLATSLASTVPFVGDRLVYLIFRDLLTVLTLIVGIKLIKVLPAKF